MDASTQCIRENGGLIPVRRGNIGQFDDSLDFTHIVRDFDRINLIRVSHEVLCESWSSDLRSWGGAHPRLCLMERIAPAFKFFVSLRLPSDVDATDFVCALRRILRAFGFAADRCAVLCDSVDAASYRFVWDDVVVDANRAYIIRGRMIAELSSFDIGENACSYRWEEIFIGKTGKAYEACLPGPSFPGSLKFGVCDICLNRVAKRRDCTQCMRRGVIILPGVLRPVALLEFDDCGAVRSPSCVPDVESCLIKATVPVSENWRVPSGTPFCIYNVGVHAPSGGLWKSRRRQISVSSSIQLLLQGVIRSSHPLFAQLVVTTRSVTSASTDKYVIHPCGIGSHTCLKYRAEHVDSYTYFVVTPRGVSQRCYSNETLNCGTSCKHKDALNIPFTDGIVHELFPSSAMVAPPSISNSTQSSAFQLASRISDYHFNICRGGANRKRNVYGDAKKAPVIPSARSAKRSYSSREDST